VTAAPVRTVFLGSGGFGRPALDALAGSAAVDLVGVVTAPPRPAGRSARLTPTLIETAARRLGVQSIQVPTRLRDPQAVAALLALRPALIVLADYGQIVPGDLLALPHGALNLHPSLLPRHRGATPVPAAILAGDEETGVSLMRMDAGLDTGPIVAQSRVALDGTEVTPTLEARLADVGAALLLEWLEPWLAGGVVPRAQDEAGASLTRPFRRTDGRLDTGRSATELERRIRALQPWPGSYLETQLGRLIVWAATVETANPDEGTPGVVDALGVHTGDGHLRLLEVQPAGGKRMAWDAFVRGRPAIIGSSIVA
jgi:methionyl-tRNA formyltransferase